MNSKTLNHSRRMIAAAVTVILTLAMSSMAADVWMTAGDNFGDHSFDSGTHWSDGQPPSTANNYYTSNQILRTDTTVSNSSWAGGNLTINPGGSVYNKFNQGITDFGATATVTNMGTLANAFAPNSICTFKGNMYVPLVMSTNTVGFPTSLLTSNSPALFTNGCSLDDQAGNQSDTADIRYLTNAMTMTGDGYVTNHNSYLQPASPPPPGYIIYAGDNTGFFGSIIIESNTLLSAVSEDALIGNPPTFRSNSLYMDGGVFQLYNPTNTNNVISPGIVTNFVLDRPNGGIWISPAGGQFDIPPGFTLSNTMALGGPGMLTLTNTGVFICAGSASNFTGELNVNIGTLIVDTATALTGPNTLSIGSGATFDASAAGMTVGSGQTLAGNGSINGAVTVNAGGTFSPGGDGNAANFGVGGLTMNDGSTIDEDFSLTTNDVINISGSLSVSGTVDIKLNSLPPASGTYTLMTIGGTVPASTANFAIKTLTTRGTSVTLSFDTGSTPKRLLATITVAPPATLTWTGNVSSLWDLTNSANWLDNGTNDVYYDLDKVNFTDAGALVQPTLNMTVNPGAVNFNSSSNYTLSGSGQIAGPVAVVQSGTGRTVLVTTNTYSGGTIISNGVLEAGNIGGTNFVPRALGNPSTTLAVVSGNGTLDIGGNPLDSSYTVPVQISGSGYNGQGAVDNSVGGFSSGSGDMGIGTLELTGNATIAATANWQIGASGAGIVGNGYTLTKIAGPGGATNGPTNNLVYLRATSANPPSSFVIAGGGVVFWNVADAVGATTPITLTNAGFIDTWDPQGNFAGLTFNNPIIVNDASKGGMIRNFRAPTFNAPPSDVFNGDVYLQAGVLTVSNVNTFTGPTFGHDTFNGNISGPGGILAIGNHFTFIGINNPIGGNVINLNGINSYTGPTTIEFGAYLNTSTASQGGGSYTVTDGGTLDVAVVPGHPATLPMSNLSVSDGFTAGYGANISFVRLAQMPTTPVIYATNFTTAYNFVAYTTIFPPGAGYTIGQYPLIKYNGSIAGYGFNDLKLGPLPGGVTGYLSNNATAHSVDLVVTAAGKAWRGDVSSSWDNATLNWTNPASSSTVTFADGDTVTFNDNAATYNVVLTRTNTAAGVTVNANNNYSWTNDAAGGILAGNGALTKLGSGTLTIGCTNQLAGGTYIYGGTIKLANRGALGRNGQDVYVANGGTLDINNWKVPNSSTFTPDGLNVYISGSGVGGNGALINSQTQDPTNDPSQTLGEEYADAGPVTLLGSATVGGPGNVDIGGGTQAHLNTLSATNVLTKVGAGKFRIRGVATVSTNFGLINILGGIVSYESASATGLGDPTKNILVGSGAGFAWGTPAALLIAPVASVRPLICSNNSTLYGWNNPTNAIESPVTLVSGNVNLSGVFYTNGLVRDAYHGLIFSNVISGNAGVKVDQQSLITFAAANTYNGDTVVSSSPTNAGGTAASVLSLVGNGSINNSPYITLLGGPNPTNADGAYGAILAVTNRSDHTLTLVSGQTLRGDDGSRVIGDVVANIGSTISPGGGGNIQSMTFDNNLTLSSGSTVVMEVSMDGAGSNDVINVTGTNNYAGTLQIANVGGTPLVAGDSFTLFNNGQYTNDFATISGSPGAGLSWSFNPATGVATVVSLGPHIGWSVSGNKLTLSWDAAYLGYTLQAQTNSLYKGINPTNNWFNVVGSSTAITNLQIINYTNGTVFYRLHQ